MDAIKFGGLQTGLLVVLATVAVAAGSASVTPVRSDAVVTPPLPTTAIPPTTKPTSLPTVTPSPAVSTRANTRLPSATPSPTTRHLPTAAPPTLPTGSVTGTPIADEGQIIGQSVEDRPIVAYRIGEGPLKVVLVGNIHGAYEANTHHLLQQLVSHFQDHPEEVPPDVSLWLIPTMNPDGLATDHRWNANGVDLNRNADTDLDGCAGNDWSPDTVGHEGSHPGAGGPYPFSEPEARAVRDFLDDTWIAVFYHSAARAIYLDTCQRHGPTGRLAEALSEGTGYPVPKEGWSGYPITGDFGDYLAGEGVAAVTVELTDHDDPEFPRNLAGVRALLAAVGDITSEEATGAGADLVWLDEGNTGAWSVATGSIIHPLALEVLDDTAFLLDGGRVLSVRLDRPTAPAVLLSPGDDVEDTRVLEPLDLASDGASLLVLDRAGDVYRYDPRAGAWTVVRYDRPPGDTYDHYFVALAASGDGHTPQTASSAEPFDGVGYLLETTHEQVWRFPIGQMGAPWINLPQSRDVDLSVRADNVHVLTRGLDAPMGNLYLYRDGRRVSGFGPNLDLMHPRQVLATDNVVYVLDRAGRRLLALDSDDGALITLYQFPDRRAVSTLWADPTGGRLVLAGRDTLYFVGEPERSATIEGDSLLSDPQPHDPTLSRELGGLLMPIEGAAVTRRDFQMPGAPRHYRLGVHEGIDFYGHTTGVQVGSGTPVRSVADGVVTRALVDYEPLTAAQADAWVARSRDLGYTPAEVLDGYRGRQIWIDHGGGVVSRYAHLGSIAAGITEGATVAAGQVIATVGNSGTPASVHSETNDAHLHLELWVGDHYVGQFLRPIEAREWLERILR